MTKPTRSWTDIADSAMALSRGPIARASVLSLGIRLAGVGLAFLQAVLTARLLGPAGYGTIATILSTAQVLAMVAMFGFGPMSVREVPALKAGGELGSLAAFLRFSFWTTFLLSCPLAALAVFAIIPVLGSASFGDQLSFGGLLIIPFALLFLMRGWAQGFGRVANAQVPGEVFRPAVMVAALLLSVLLGYSFTERDYLTVAIIAATLAMAGSLFLLWRSDLRALPRPDGAESPDKTLIAALPFLGLGLASILQGEINTLLLAAFSTPEQTGLFQPLARIMPLLILPIQATGMRYAPRIAELWKSGEVQRVRSITRTFTWTTTLITLALGLVICLAGPWLMLVFGREFVDVAPLLWIVAAGQLLNAACGPVGMVLSASGHARAALWGHIAGLTVNFLAGLILIPRHGVWGATIAMVVGIVMWNCVLLVMAKRKTGIDPSLVSLLHSRSDER